jgi:hypothetical protein
LHKNGDTFIGINIDNKPTHCETIICVSLLWE